MIYLGKYTDVNDKLTNAKSINPKKLGVVNLTPSFDFSPTEFSREGKALLFGDF